MAERRMFAKTIIDSDAFLDMPASTQNLYFHLSMRADDDGFVNNPKKIQRMIGSGDDDTKLLLAKQFILGFESGIIVIKHWKMHNYIQKDRYKATVYEEEKSLLETKDNKAYTYKPKTLENTQCIQNVYSMDTQVRLGKVRLGKVRLGNMCETEKVFESLWATYPKKRGKASISDKKKKEIFNIGEEQMQRCIDRYIKECKDFEYMKNGSTFFNSGYVDYLDENYTPLPKDKKTETIDFTKI